MRNECHFLASVVRWNAFHVRFILWMDVHHPVMCVVCTCHFSPLSMSFVSDTFNHSFLMRCVGRCSLMWQRLYAFYFVLLQVSFHELIMFAENRGVALMSNMCGFSSRPIKSVGDYFNAIMESLLINVKRLVVNVSKYHQCHFLYPVMSTSNSSAVESSPRTRGWGSNPVGNNFPFQDREELIFFPPKKCSSCKLIKSSDISF